LNFRQHRCENFKSGKMNFPNARNAKSVFSSHFTRTNNEDCDVVCDVVVQILSEQFAQFETL
jgi:hypothetical protein